MYNILRQLTRFQTILPRFETKRFERTFSSSVSGETQLEQNKATSSSITANPNKLTPEQYQFYQDKGYLLIKGLISTQDVSNYIQRFNDIANGTVKLPGLTIQKDISFKDQERNERTVYKLQELFLDESLFSYCKNTDILDYVQDIIGSNIMAIHTMLINKPPDSGSLTSRHPLHQDLHYFPIRPTDKIIGVWTALDRCFRDNGCLVILPGSHKGHLMEHDYPDWEAVNKMYHGIKMKPPEDRLHVEMDPGDTLFFHPLLIHGSGTNRTLGYRKAISCHYAASDCNYIDVKDTTQENISNEVLEITRKKFGLQIDDVSVIWRFRAQLVRGERINL